MQKFGLSTDMSEEAINVMNWKEYNLFS